MRRAARGVGLLSLGVAVAGCGYTYARQAEEVKQELIGLRAPALRGCIGVPAAVDLDGDVEYLTYRWSIDASQTPSPAPLDLPPDEARPDPDQRRRALSVDGSEEGLCELVFELRDGRVTGLEAEGRTPEGLNWNAGCTLLARRCLPRRS